MTRFATAKARTENRRSGSGFFLVTVLLQVGLGYSALQAGAAGLPMTVLLAFLSSRIGALVPRVGSRPLLTVGCVGMAAGLLLLSLLRPESSYLTGVLPAIVVFAGGLAFVVAPVTTTALADVEPAQSGAASGVNNAVARIGGLLAIAVLPLVGGLGGGALTGGAEFVAGYARTQRLAAVLCLVGAVISWFGFTARTGRACDPTDLRVEHGL